MNTLLKYVITLFVVVIWLPLKSQNTLAIYPEVHYIMPISSVSYDEYALGYYEFDHNRPHYFSYGISVEARLNRLLFSFSSTYQSWSHDFSFRLQNGQSQSEVIDEASYDLNFKTIGFGPKIGFAITERFNCLISYKLNYPLTVEYSEILSGGSRLHLIFDGNNNVILPVSVYERIQPFASGFANNLLALNFEYHIIDNVVLELSLIKNISRKKDNIYRLIIDGSNFEYPESNVSFNDILVTSDLLGIGIGLKYRIQVFSW